MFAGLLIAAVTGLPGASNIAVKSQALGYWALYMLIILVASLLFIVAMLSVALARRRRELTSSLDKLRPTSNAVDPWIEAGRRASIPDSEDQASKAKRFSYTSGESARPKPPASTPGSSSSPEPRPFLPTAAFSGNRPIALITGGARRVGRATCIEMAKSGCDIVFTYNQSSEDAQTLLAELRNIGVTCVSHQVDLLNIDQVDLFGSFVADSLPRLDVLIHNASVYTPTPFHDLTADESIQQMIVNALSPLILTARFAPLLRRSPMNGGGAIVAMLDIHALGRPRKDFIAYSMSKAALAEMVYSAARELAPNVRVNGVAPGVVNWPETGNDSTSTQQARYLKRVPLERAGTPEDAAAAVRWLALEATYTTGQILRIDGGRWIT